MPAKKSQRGRLSRDVIRDQAAELIAEDGIDKFSLRSVAKALGVDASALYRHYEDLDDLLRDVGDKSLYPVTARFVASDDPVEDVRKLLLRLRKVLLTSGVARITATGPTRREGELRITEAMLEAGERAGLSQSDAVMAYHVLIEYTVGSAAIDAPLSASKTDRAETYKRWRSDYEKLDRAEYPSIKSHVSALYPPSDKVFETGLDALLSSLFA